MQIVKLKIKNFRGISEAELSFNSHTVIIGDNNSCKSTILEAIDLVLGPERLSRTAPIDEHDFYGGRYLNEDGTLISIYVEVLVIDLTVEQLRRFNAYLEFWDQKSLEIIESPPLENINLDSVKEALRIGFRGWYDSDDDDFKTETFFLNPEKDDAKHESFKSSDKRACGFLFLRALRTGSRALSLERGSLLDIILRIKELRPKIWEPVLKQLRDLTVADDPNVGMSGVLSNLQIAIRDFAPQDWGSDPHLRVTDLTRESLRRTLTVFLATGAKNGEHIHSAPFQHQGTGTINMLVLALLSMIAELKQTVIFAMEEPEIAIPPHAQKRIVDGVRNKSFQALFTSHSPFVLEEFPPNNILMLQRDHNGKLFGKPIVFPSHIKPKAYSNEYRLRFAEALLAKRILIVEGDTEMLAYPAAARRLGELKKDEFLSLEALGIAIFNAKTDSQIATYGKFFGDLGKVTFAIYDKQFNLTQSAAIKAAVKHPYESTTKGFESLLLDEIGEPALRRFSDDLVANNNWPSHLVDRKPTSNTSIKDLRVSLGEYLKWGKGIGAADDLIAECTLDEMPHSIKTVLASIKSLTEIKVSENFNESKMDATSQETAQIV
jgi:putative ATP-dependent endonuclease of OLD family